MKREKLQAVLNSGMDTMLDHYEELKREWGEAFARASFCAAIQQHNDKRADLENGTDKEKLDVTFDTLAFLSTALFFDLNDLGIDDIVIMPDDASATASEVRQ